MLIRSCTIRIRRGRASAFLDLSLGSLVFDDDALLASLLDANDFVAKVKSDIPPADRSDADSALKLLGKTATWRERKILGNVLYL
jgi:hypothetical protein